MTSGQRGRFGNDNWSPMLNITTKKLTQNTPTFITTRIKALLPQCARQTCKRTTRQNGNALLDHIRPNFALTRGESEAKQRHPHIGDLV
jgi:hypothetical protein